MTQDTRKDPRAKVLTMTVRYKSATLDEFIEHHSYDVSRGGMFIKTPSPFPPGTLLKFEVKISAEQRVMQGVGRVVWKRETSEVSDARPAGMGVKFIKIDDDSRKVIDQLVTARGDSTSAYEQGGDGSPPARPGIAARATDATATPRPQVVAPPMRAQGDASAAMAGKQRKATMMGLGAMQPETESPETAAAEAFFPPPQPDMEMPAPEDRTVMKQAAELLQEALREAGGSLDDVSAEKEAAPPKVERKPEPVPAEPAPPIPTGKSEPATAARTGETRERSVIVNARPREEVTQPAVRRTSAAPAARKSEPPRARGAALQEAAGPAADGGGGRLVLALIAVAAAAGVVYFLTKPEAEMPEPLEPPPIAQPEVVPEPTPERTPLPEPTAAAEPEPESEPSDAAASASAAASAPAAAPLGAPVVPAPTVEQPVKPTVLPAPRPAAKPRPQKPKPAEPPAGAAPPDVTPPSAPEPTPTAAPEPEPTPKPAPKPAPAPKAPEPGDNPY